MAKNLIYKRYQNPVCNVVYFTKGVHLHRKCLSLEIALKGLPSLFSFLLDLKLLSLQTEGQLLQDQI